MERISFGKTRPNWQQLVSDQGLTYWRTQLPGGGERSYWSEQCYYTISSAEQEQMEADQRTLMEMFVQAGDSIVARPDLMDRLQIPVWARRAVINSWNAVDKHGNDTGSVYGRIDVVYGGNRELDPDSTDAQDLADPDLGRIRLYEFNADTPTSLLETNIQWDWFDKLRQGSDQWNSAYEALVDAWTRNLGHVEDRLGRKPRIHFACTWEDNLLPELADDVPPEVRAAVNPEDCSFEDLQNLRVLQDTCEKAGYDTEWLYLQQIHLGEDGRFYDGRPGKGMAHIDVIFKLHAWEFIVEEDFGQAVFEDLARTDNTGTIWIEPPYKMLWSNKAILPILWQMFGEDPERSKLLIPAWFEGEQPAGLSTYVRKVILGREGANVTVVVDGETVMDTPGVYGHQPAIIQAYAPPPNFPGINPANNEPTDNYPTLGLWYVDGEPAGLDVRENPTIIADNLSVFVPHTIR
jgi:glutathionylspermidine synthase